MRGDQAYHAQPRPLVVQSSVGAIRLERRAYYRCAACTTSGYPLDERLGQQTLARFSWPAVSVSEVQAAPAPPRARVARRGKSYGLARGGRVRRESGCALGEPSVRAEYGGLWPYHRISLLAISRACPVII